jgi:hypothetical protein
VPYLRAIFFFGFHSHPHLLHVCLFAYLHCAVDPDGLLHSTDADVCSFGLIEDLFLHLPLYTAGLCSAMLHQKNWVDLIDEDQVVSVPEDDVNLLCLFSTATSDSIACMKNMMQN